MEFAWLLLNGLQKLERDEVSTKAGCKILTIFSIRFLSGPFSYLCVSVGCCTRNKKRQPVPRQTKTARTAREVSENKITIVLVNNPKFFFSVYIFIFSHEQLVVQRMLEL